MKNKINQSFELVILVFIILFAVSFLPVEGEFLGVEFKQIDLFSDLKADSDEYYEEDDFFEDWEDEEEATESSVQSMMRTTESENNLAGILPVRDILEVTYDFFDAENDKINKFMDNSIQPKKKVNIVGNTKQMSHFVNALKKAKTKKVRIAHYGDSQIEGDLITSDIREHLRKKFGGVGAGYLALTSQDITFRVTTKHEYPESKWETGSIFMGNEGNLPYGISGESFVPKAKATVSYTTYDRYYRSSSKFNEITIIYSDAKASNFKATLNNKPQTVKLNKGGGFHEAQIKSKSSVRSLKLNFDKNKAAILYGVFLEGGNGVYVDNFPLRGNSGEDLDKIPTKTLKDFNKLRDYKLIIFQFGKNAISGNYKRYEREMVKVIDKYKTALPKTSFLLVSVQDSGFKTSARMLNLLKAQKNIAKETNIAFWNLFKAMGGKNSMTKWVKHNPPLASADHTHFNLQGAQIVGEMLSEALIDLYNKMK